MYRSEWFKVILRVKVAGRVMISVWVGIRIYIRFRDMSYSPSKGGGTNIKPTTYCCDSTNEWAYTWD